MGIGITGSVLRYLQPITVHAFNHVGLTQTEPRAGRKLDRVFVIVTHESHRLISQRETQ